jgi:6-phosphogluconolactonase/glucosamine-6-phosphate isomerase/deaminase
MVMQNVTKTEAEHIIAEKIKSSTKKRILYLLSGGSSASVGVAALGLLGESVRKKISVAMVDERFVPYNTKDSNAYLLKKLGIFDFVSVFDEVLENNSESDRNKAAQNYENKLSNALEDSDYIIAVLGIGVDNHTAGILPGINFNDSNNLVVDYSSDTFERISISPHFFNSIDMLFVYVEGDEKESAVMAVSEVHDSVDYPSQLIKNAKQYEILYNKGKLL